MPNKQGNFFKNFINFDSSYNDIAIKKIIDQDKGSLFINGWNFSPYVFSNTYNPKFDTSYVSLNFITEQKNIQHFIDGQYEYVGDVVGKSGYMNDSSFSLENSENDLGQIVAAYYDRIYESEKIVLYKRKSGLKLGAETIISVENISRSKSNFCAQCVPHGEASIRQFLPSIQYGSYGRGLDADKGSYQILFTPIKNRLYKLLYTVGPDSSGQNISIKYYCKNSTIETESVSQDKMRVHEINTFNLNFKCQPNSVSITFSDNSNQWGGWIGFIDLLEYNYQAVRD
jgi:hypothetical protein